jgi:aspartate-semialdehyde dehydrogenase
MQVIYLLSALLAVLPLSSAFLRAPSSSRSRLNAVSLRNPTMMASKPVSVGIVGATGAVGEEILSVMEKRNFPASQLKLFASEKSSGKEVNSSVYGKLKMEPFTFEVASKLDVVLMAVSGDFALEWAEKLASAGVLVIDNSSAFRYKDHVPLVVPEINIEAAKGKKLVANPNCTTAIALMALWPIHQKYKIKKAIVSTYQAASGAGAPGMQELKDGMKTIVEGGVAQNKVFAHPLPYNIIPHIDVFQDNAYTKEEMKVTWESRKIMNAPDLKLSCTAVRIPTLRAHSEAITIETEKPIKAADVRELLKSAPGVRVVDDPANKKYPMPMTATNSFDIEVGRIRENDVFDDRGLDLFVSGDQVRNIKEIRS